MERKLFQGDGVKYSIVLLIAFLSSCNSTSQAAVIFGNSGLTGGARWDAAPKSIGGNERSLNGGLRYSLEGGSFQAYRDMFSWAGTPPSVASFQAAVEQSFTAWTIDDPASGLDTDLSFVADLSTPVVGAAPNSRVNVNGAEIDLLAETNGFLWNSGDSSLRAETFFDWSTNSTVTLTSGTASYSGHAISGVDLKMNNNPGALWNLTRFQSVMTHEIGHAIGLGDVDVSSSFGLFIDDNYNGSSNSTALATLNNSWAGLVDPLNPAASPLAMYNVANGSPGVDTFGVDILMETIVPAVFNGDPTPLRNDDFGGRQFLYPALGAGPPAVTPSPIVKYRLPASWDGLSSTVTDLSGEGNDGSPSGSPTLAASIPPGATAGAMSLDTHNGGLLTNDIDLLRNSSVASAGGFRFELDIFWDGTTNGFDIQKIIDYAGTEFLQLENSDLLAGTVELRFGFNDTSGFGPTFTLAANEWYHIQATFDSEGNLVDGNGDLAGTATLTVDGTSVSQAVFKSALGDGLDRPIGFGTFSNQSGIVDFNGLIFNPVVSIGNPALADFNGDGFVDAADFNDWQTHFGIGAGADADGDSDSDGADFLVWQRQFGAGASSVAASSTIPEPNTAILLVIALGTMFFFRYGRSPTVG